jgi:hypothetical protein
VSGPRCYVLILRKFSCIEVVHPRFDSGQGQEILLLVTASRPALGPTQPLIQYVSGALSLGVKLQGREADHSPPYSAEVNKQYG